MASDTLLDGDKAISSSCLRALVGRRPLFVLAFLLFLGSAHVTDARTITFAGMTWEVRSGTGGPGNGCWNDDPESVWVDESGRLHLKVRKLPDGRWCQAEVSALSFADYGDHTFHTSSRIDKLGPSIVLGMFLYADDYHEIDIEATRAFDPDKNLLYVLQPFAQGEPRSSFGSEFSLNGEQTKSYSSHRISWSDDGSAAFRSWHGHCEDPPCGGTIASWTYSGPNTPTNTWLLEPIINLWIRGDDPSEPEEVIISSYKGPQVPTPSTMTGREGNVTWTSATLNGLVSPNGWPSTAWFEYGTSTSYSASTRSHKQSIGDEASWISAPISDLECGTTYHFRIVGENVAGRAWGEDRTFTTYPCDGGPPRRRPSRR